MVQQSKGGKGPAASVRSFVQECGRRARLALHRQQPKQHKVGSMNTPLPRQHMHNEGSIDKQYTLMYRTESL